MSVCRLGQACGRAVMRMVALCNLCEFVFFSSRDYHVSR